MTKKPTNYNVLSGSDIPFLSQGFGLGGWLPKTIAAPTDKVALANLSFQLKQGSDDFWMAHALCEAMKGIGRSAPNPSVGCVFVKNNQIIARGATQAFGGLHAEVSAIEGYQGDRSDLKGATCYVTLEPCSHFGKQSPCVDKLIASGIDRCVIACLDPYDKVNGEGVRRLRSAKVSVSIGVLHSEVLAWHFPFLLYQKKKSPILVGKWAQTLDGKLSDDLGSSKWITGPFARSHTHWLRQKYDAILVGAGTVLADKPKLTVRDCALPHHRHPLRLVFDPNGRLILDKNKIASLEEMLAGGQKLVYGVKKTIWEGQARSMSLAKLEAIGLIPIFLQGSLDIFDEFVELCDQLYPSLYDRKCLQSIMIEGGPRLLNLVLHGQKLDAAHVFINPSFMGPSRYQIADYTSGVFGQCEDRQKYLTIAMNRLGQDTLLDLVAPGSWHLVANTQTVSG